MKKHDTVQMLGFLDGTHLFQVLVLLGFGGSSTAKYVTMNNQPCIVRPTLIDLNPDEVYYYTFIISLDKCGGSCNISEDPFW